MQPDVIPAADGHSASARSGWLAACTRLGLLALALFALTMREWFEMATIWWHSDTYSHILLIPPIIAWLAWLRHEDLKAECPRGWWPGLVLLGGGLAFWVVGRALDVNLLAHAGAVTSQAALVLAVLGPRVGALLALPLVFSVFLVPFGDEIVPPLQYATAEMAVVLTRLAGVPAEVDGLFIDTPAGLFVVAEACAGVQFLVAMVALGFLASFTAFDSWKRRIFFLTACVIVPILANGIRAWATICVAQFIGAEAASSFDHIVYGWIFFGIVVAIVLGGAWRFFEREPEDAGWSREELARSPLLHRLERYSLSNTVIVLAAGSLMASFAMLAFGVAGA